MIGTAVHFRRRRVTSTPSASGIIKSTMTASGGLSAAASSASETDAVGLTVKPMGARSHAR